MRVNDGEKVATISVVDRFEDELVDTEENESAEETTEEA